GVEVGGAGGFGDAERGSAGDHSGASLGAGECSLEIEHGLQHRGVRKHLRQSIGGGKALDQRRRHEIDLTRREPGAWMNSGRPRIISCMKRILSVLAPTLALSAAFAIPALRAAEMPAAGAAAPDFTLQS